MLVRLLVVAGWARTNDVLWSVGSPPRKGNHMIDVPCVMAAFPDQFSTTPKTSSSLPTELSFYI
jgi:hypothetical protein